MTRSIAVAFSLAVLLLAPARAYAVENACTSNPNACSPNAICTTTGPATFACTCRAGYSGDGKTCVEIDACLSNPCDRNATCTKTGPGAFACTCKAGYSGDGRACTSIALTQPSPSTIPPKPPASSSPQPNPSTIPAKPPSSSAFVSVDLDRSVAPSVYLPVGSEVRAFIATGSTGPVIGSLSDCSPCNITFSSFTARNFADQNGVLVTVIFSAPTPINQDLKVTFQQQGLTDTSVIKAPIFFNGQ
jgi:EGF domain